MPGGKEGGALNEANEEEDSDSSESVMNLDNHGEEGPQESFIGQLLGMGADRAHPQTRKASRAYTYDNGDNDDDDDDNNGKRKRGGKPEKKLGTIMGVYLPCMQNILGVILFLRLPWITAQAGIWMTVGVILICVCTTFLTVLSMSAVVTNGKVPAGGPYALVSRNLGAAFGGAIGVLFFLGTSIAGTMYVIGAIDAINLGFPSIGTGIFGCQMHQANCGDVIKPGFSVPGFPIDFVDFATIANHPNASLLEACSVEMSNQAPTSQGGVVERVSTLTLGETVYQAASKERIFTLAGYLQGANATVAHPVVGAISPLECGMGTVCVPLLYGTLNRTAGDAASAAAAAFFGQGAFDNLHDSRFQNITRFMHQVPCDWTKGWAPIIMGVVLAFCMANIVSLGMVWVNRSALVFLTLVILSIFAIFVGSIIWATPDGGAWVVGRNGTCETILGVTNAAKYGITDCASYQSHIANTATSFSGFENAVGSAAPKPRPRVPRCPAAAAGGNGQQCSAADFTLKQSWSSDFEPDLTTGQLPSFTSMLALFYPSVTGIMAGANRSAKLADPGVSVPLGTFAAILTTTLIYLLTVFLMGTSVDNYTLKNNYLVVASLSWPHRYVVRIITNKYSV